MRAGAMGAAATVAQLSGRPASRWYALLLACAFTLAIDPRAWLDAGWQLSFAAVVGIFCLGPAIRRSLQMLPAPLAEGAALTVAATLATAPLMAFHFERLSVVSLAREPDRAAGGRADHVDRHAGGRRGAGLD